MAVLSGIFTTRPLDRDLTLNTPTLFTATHRGQPVQVVQLMEKPNSMGFEGLAQVSVWQDLQQRQALAAELAIQSGLTALFTDQHGLPCRCLWNQNWPEAPFFS